MEIQVVIARSVKIEPYVEFYWAWMRKQMLVAVFLEIIQSREGLFEGFEDCVELFCQLRRFHFRIDRPHCVPPSVAVVVTAEIFEFCCGVASFVFSVPCVRSL